MRRKTHLTLGISPGEDWSNFLQSGLRRIHVSAQPIPDVAPWLEGSSFRGGNPELAISFSSEDSRGILTTQHLRCGLRDSGTQGRRADNPDQDH